ncbi:hypothetical protein [Roseomonas sp. 18066]|uniref:hypothetical protein n=1 Tax=Roseomonas sp. 18066 TaxID=2681412 RepID=UPI001356D090|nr:hypothetical protein [Roseomonas sp. 18066]
MHDHAPSRLTRWLRPRRDPGHRADAPVAGDAADDPARDDRVRPGGRGPAFGILLGLGLALVFWALLAALLLR